MLADTKLPNPLSKALKIIEGLTDIPVVAEMPPGKRKIPIVVVEIVHITDATPVTSRVQTAVWVWAHSPKDAYELSEKIRQGLIQHVNKDGITRVKRVDGPVYMPEPSSGTPRYFTQFLIDIRAEKHKTKGENK